MSIEDEVKYKDDSTTNLKLKEDGDSEAPSQGPAKIRTQYTYEKLLSFRHSPVVKNRPDCLAEEFFNEDGTWDPELWHASLSGGKKSRSSSRSTSPAFSLKPNRKPSDAKERLKLEQDGIVLSPQRRSFGHGCQISFTQVPSSLASEPRPTRPKSPLDRNYRERSNSDLVDVRPGPGRRRVIARPSRETLLGKEKLREQEPPGYDGQDHRYKRQTSFERQPDQRVRGNQPEWLTDVPSSNLEQIELHGFGEAEEAEREVVKGQTRRDSSLMQPTELDHLVASLQSSAEQQQATTPSKEFDINDFFNFSDPISTSPAEEHTLAQSRFSHLFNAPLSLDGRSSRGSSRRSSLHKEELDFLQELRGHSGSESDAGSTPIHALINDAPETTPFTLLEMLQRGQENLDVENDMRKREVQQKLMEGQAKSLAEIEAELKKETIKKRRRSSGSLPPVARGGSPADAEDQSAFTNFIAALGKSKDPGKTVARESVAHATPVTDSRRSPVALLFQNGPSSEYPQHPMDQYVRSELEELHNRGVSPLSRGSLLEMLNTSQHSTASSEASFVQRQSPMTPDQLANILQQQIAANQRQRAAGQEVLANVVKQAVVTNPGLVASILSSQQEGRAAQQRALSPQERYQQALLQQQQQAAAAQRAQSPLVSSPLGFIGTHSPLTPSPLPGGVASPLGPASHLIPPPPMGVAVPPPGAHQPSPIRPRIPSPQELVKHTQNILQQALIKRQLEVQREKFYARERDTRSRSPVPGTPGHAGQRRRTPPVTPTSRPSSTVSTAFTPTSVIRRMHDTKAEAKEAEARHTPEPIEGTHSAADSGGQSEPNEHIPANNVGSPLRKPDPPDPVTPLMGGHSSPMKGEDPAIHGQPSGPPSGGYSSPQRRGPPPGQPDFGGSPSQRDQGRGDAAEISKHNSSHDDTKATDSRETDPKTMTANGDMVPPTKVLSPGMSMQLGPQPTRAGPPELPNHHQGVTEQPPGPRQMPSMTQPSLVNGPPGIPMGMGAKQQMPPDSGVVPPNSAQVGPEQGQKPQGPPPHQPEAGPQEQPRPAMRMANPLPRPQMMQTRPPVSPAVPPQFPVMHPAAAAAAAAVRGMTPMTPLHPMAQQMRSMMYTVPPPRAPTVPTAVNPMAFLAMQQLNQRAVMTQMQMPTAQSPIPGQGLQRPMLPPQYPPSQPALHHHPGNMGVPMVNPRNHLAPHHQMGPPPRMPLQQHGGKPDPPTDGSSQMDHLQRSTMFSMPPPTTTNAGAPGASPDNPLAKWFGNDLLSHSMAQPPKVPEGLKVLSVEELERQQQVVS